MITAMKPHVFRKHPVRYYSGLLFGIFTFLAIGSQWLFIQVLLPWYSDVIINPGKVRAAKHGYALVLFAYFALSFLNVFCGYGLSETKMSFLSWWRRKQPTKRAKLKRQRKRECEIPGEGGQGHEARYVLALDGKDRQFCFKHLAEFLEYDHRALSVVTASILSRQCEQGSDDECDEEGSTILEAGIPTFSLLN